MDRERERLISDSVERDRDRDRDRTFESSQIESVKRCEAKLEGEHERDLESTSRDSVAVDKERMDKDLGSVQGFEDINKSERTESLEGECYLFFGDTAFFLFRFHGKQLFSFERASTNRHIDFILHSFIGEVDIRRKRPMRYRRIYIYIFF